MNLVTQGPQEHVLERRAPGGDRIERCAERDEVVGEARDHAGVAGGCDPVLPRLLLDAARGLLWVDDRQIASLTLSKARTAGEPRLELVGAIEE